MNNLLSFWSVNLDHLCKHGKLNSTVCLILDSNILYIAHQELCKYISIQYCCFTESIWPKCIETNVTIIISKQLYLGWVHHIPDTYLGLDNFGWPTSSHNWMIYVLLFICIKKIIWIFVIPIFFQQVYKNTARITLRSCYMWKKTQQNV